MEDLLRAATRDDCLAMLRWQIDMGVDLALEDEPQDRFAESLKSSPPAAAPAPRGAPASVGRTLPEPRAEAPKAPSPTPPADASATSLAEALAREATNLEELRAALDGFDACGLKRTATQLVFADGRPGAPLMLIGEAPGAEEDRVGRPFVGRAGQLLDRMLAAIGLDRQGVYIANVVPWRPPGNRTPTPLETALCKPFILRQIALARPHAIMCLGNSSAQTLLGFREGITRSRGRWTQFVAAESGEPPIAALATLHPAYLLRRPADKRLAWRDFRLVRRALDQIGARA